MAGYWTDLFSYVTGGVRRRDVAYLARVSDELATSKTEHSYFSVWH